MIQVLVPTHHKSKEDIINLYHFLNIKSDALIANQNGKDENYTLNIDGHKVDVICTNTIGVSKNRNILLDNCSGDICLCTDDDCVLNDDYIEVVTKFFDKYKCDCVLFNGLVPYEGNRKVHNKRTKRVRRFSDVSYAGGPGFAFKKKLVIECPLRYFESLGFPNDVSFGEDSLFYLTLIKYKPIFYRSMNEIFTVMVDKEDNSTYFAGLTDAYFINKGTLLKTLYPKTMLYHGLKESLKYRIREKLPISKSYKQISVGFHSSESPFNYSCVISSCNNYSFLLDGFFKFTSMYFNSLQKHEIIVTVS